MGGGGSSAREDVVTGATALSDAELIAILIGSGSAEETAVELSRRILHAVDNDLDDLGRRNSDFLTRFKGIGEAKAINILAAMELAAGAGKSPSQENPPSPAATRPQPL